MNRVSATAIDSWILSPKPAPNARLRLFCFPYAGAGASIFRNWCEGLPAEIEVCAIQLPGRATRLMEPAFTELSPLVDALATALAPLFDQPFALFGHSLGALVTFELTRSIRRRYGVQPVRLIISAARAPQIPHRSMHLHTLPEIELIAELRRLNGTPEELLDHKELMHLVLPALRADFAVYENYRYSVESPLNCPISAFGGLQDPGVSESDLAAWSAQTNSSFSIQMLRGDHFFIHQPLLLQAILRQLESIYQS
jgi:surfactin synthase thioesterase subunit